MNTLESTPDGRVPRARAAAILGLSAKTLANWGTRGLGPRSIRVGGRRFYYVADLFAFIDEGAQQ
jgi:DNA-binding transcriptional MerR regulator